MEVVLGHLCIRMANHALNSLEIDAESLHLGYICMPAAMRRECADCVTKTLKSTKDSCGFAP